MQLSHRGRRSAVVALTTLAMLASATAASADSSTDGSAAPHQIGGTARFPQYALPATLDMSNLPNHADPDLEVSALVQLVGDSAVTLGADAAAANQRVDPGAARTEVLAGQQAVSQQLRAAGASIQGSITTVLNAVRVRVKVRDLPALAAVPGVTDVHVSRKFHLDNAHANALTGVNAVWEDLGVTGTGMTIAVIDDGIDYYHADFGGIGGQAAYEADDGLSIEPGTFPTAKVIAGYDFAGDAYDAEADQPGESPIPVPDPDPLACGVHGTHVSGTAAGQGVLADGSTFTGPYDATTMANAFLVAPGSAPEASIEIYKVFGCDGSSDDDVIVAAIDAAVASGADVINMSLGSDFGTAADPFALAVEAASAAGVVVVTSAGNAGPSPYMVGSPSTANSAISVAALDAVPTIGGVSVTGAITAVEQNSNEFQFTGPITGELVDVGLGCSLDELAPAAGKIAITTRGDCDRVARAILGTQAGALGVVFVNNAAGLPPVEGPIDGATVPFVGVSPEEGALYQAAVGQSVTFDAGPDLANPGYRMLAGFSSAGPRGGDSALKPDIAAPGVSVLSAHAGTGTGGILESGTSMASPHTAGIAALVRQTHPGWDPQSIKAALMSTAAPEGVIDYSARGAGAGLVQARSAVDTVAFTSTNDGLNNLSFGFDEFTHGLFETRSFHITNTSAAAITYDLSSAIDDGGTGATIKIEPSVVTVPAGHSRKVSVTIRISDPSVVPGAADNDGGSLTTVDGIIVAQPRQAGTGIHALVTPLLMVPNAVSNVRATAVRNWSHGGKGVPTRIKLYNSGSHAGDADFYQWAIKDDVGDSTNPAVPDIRDVGVQSFPFDETGSLLVFAINTATSANTQSIFQYEIDIDTSGDGVADYFLVGMDNGLLTAGDPDGTMASALFAADGTPLSLFGATAPANGTTVEVAVPTAAMGNPGLFSFVALAYSADATIADFDETDVGYYDVTSPALHAEDPTAPGGDFPFVSLVPQQYAPIDVGVDRVGVYRQHALGWLVVTTDDAAGAREADRVALRP